VDRVGVWRAFYAPRAGEEKQILPMDSFESVEAIRGHTNSMNNRGERMAIIDGLKSIPYGREIKLVTHPPYAITVAYYSNPKRKNMDLIH
jgi:hypothetical protein